MGNGLVAVASGLFTTFTPSTPAGQWIGYQVLGGFGRGLVMQLVWRHNTRTTQLEVLSLTS